jgi:hypothetical protein
MGDSIFFLYGPEI